MSNTPAQSPNFTENVHNLQSTKNNVHSGAHLITHQYIGIDLFNACNICFMGRKPKEITNKRNQMKPAQSQDLVMENT